MEIVVEARAGRQHLPVVRLQQLAAGGRDPRRSWGVRGA